MKPLIRTVNRIRRGFTVIELMVALVVTGILASMLLRISNDVLNTYNQTTGELDSNLAARFVLDQLAEDFQAAVSRRDGRVWLAVTVRKDENSKNLTGQWSAASSVNKPIAESLRMGEKSLDDCRFGVGGVWLRLITQSPDALSGQGGARAVSYLIDRRVTGSPESESSGLSSNRYTLFRGDVSPKESFEAGFNLHPAEGDYRDQPVVGETRDPGQVKSPAWENGLIDNVIDFGLRFYVKDPDPESVFLNGLRPIFPVDTGGNWSNNDFEHLATTGGGEDPYATIYPEVVDVMVRVLTMEGADAIRAFEEGNMPRPDGYSSDGEYWWFLAEQYSYVFVRRIQLYPSGV
jgi:prepilin-type N-terminal cleavage/methylation domain-containing protein